MTKYTIISCSCVFDSIWKYTSGENVSVTWAFRGSNSIILSFIRIMWFKLNLPMKEIWIKTSLRNLDGICIIFDSCANNFFLEWFKKNNPRARCIFYFWNSIAHKRLNHNYIHSLGYEIWSFDPKDAATYHLHYNPQFFCSSWYRNLKNTDTSIYDISFVGRDSHGRMQKIEQIITDITVNTNLTSNLYFTAPKWYLAFSNLKYRRILNFPEMLEEEMKGKAILDIVPNSQNGYSLRIFDALCNGKKLITNNLNILNEDFYDKNNIFIYGYDSINELPTFINTPPQKNQHLNAVYNRELKYWLMRFSEMKV